MMVRVAFFFYLLAALASAEASVLSRRSEAVVRTAGRAHRRGTSFVRDLRLTYSGMRTRRSDLSARSQKAFCINVESNSSSLVGSDDSNGRGGASSASSAAASGTAAPSGTSSAAPAPSSSVAASQWKLKQSYVSATFSKRRVRETNAVIRRRETRSLLVGPSSQKPTPLVALWITLMVALL